MIKRNNKKGFTIVELVIVIAVIAILAAVLIPTFSGIIKKANISADTQLCKNMNTALSMAKAEGKALDTMEDVLFAINEAGYVIENLNPTTEGYYFAWDQKNGQILFLNEALGLHYPEDATLNPADCWITVGDKKEAADVAAKGFALYLEPGFSGELSLDKLVSVDAGVNNVNALTIKSDAEGSIVIRGSYGTVTLDAKNADADQYGVVNAFNVTAVKEGTLKINGFVKEISVTAGKVVVNATGVVNEIKAGADKFAPDSKGIIVTGAPTGYTPAANVTINNKAELEAFRDIVNGGYNYDGITVTLNADIDLAGVAWTPIGNSYRAEDAAFSGTFDGGNHTIKNLSNNGFSVSELKFGTVTSSIANYVEANYGLFGAVNNATIKNLTVNADINMIPADGKLGDSVGAIVGFAKGNFTMENCKATGSIKAHDNVGGLVGYIKYSTSATVSNCTNEATVTSIRKSGGVVGFITSCPVTFTNCTNKGTVTCLGTTADVVVGKDGYYVSGKITVAAINSANTPIDN